MRPWKVVATAVISASLGAEGASVSSAQMIRVPGVVGAASAASGFSPVLAGPALEDSFLLTTRGMGLQLSALQLPSSAVPVVGTSAVPAGPVPVQGGDGAAKEQRAKFRCLLVELARISQGKPLTFKEQILQPDQHRGGYGYVTRHASYALFVREQTEFPDAFFLRFSGPSRDFSTLVAYEGYNNYKMGTLEVNGGGETATYVHLFNGLLKDRITLEVVQGKIIRFSYEKVNPQGVIFNSLEWVP